MRTYDATEPPSIAVSQEARQVGVRPEESGHNQEQKEGEAAGEGSVKRRDHPAYPSDEVRHAAVVKVGDGPHSSYVTTDRARPISSLSRCTL